MIFEKIKFNPEKFSCVELRYRVKRENGPDEKFAYECWEEPHADFKAAMKALSTHVPGLIEAPQTWAEAITVIGVTLNKDDGGAVLSALRSLDKNNSPMVINTPYVSEGAADRGEGLMGVIPFDLTRDLNTLLVEAEAYIGGKRAQGELDFTEEAESASA